MALLGLQGMSWLWIVVVLLPVAVASRHVPVNERGPVIPLAIRTAFHSTC